MTGAGQTSQTALAKFVKIFEEACGLDPENLGSETLPLHVLNGQASAEIRRLVPIGERRRLGAFFTPHELANELASPLRSAQGPVTVVDPCCGAGDLLLAGVRALGRSVHKGTASADFVGIDIVDEFSRVARMRFELLTRNIALDVSGTFIADDGLAAPDVRAATHILLNPPFAAVPSQDGCEWASGTVNGAGAFLARVIEGLSPDVEVSAILPDVLRSGSRYRRWREAIAGRLDLDTPEPKGRFDPWTDVDVFILRGRARPAKKNVGPSRWVPSTTGPTVGDRFDISVGPLVDYRSPIEGPRVPYLVSKDFPAWGTIVSVEGARRFSGRLHEGPIVVMPRTSRPGDPYRARAAVVSDRRGIAVENHLLVLKPRRGGTTECRRLVRRLQCQDVNDWLDRAIRCRHLTVGAVASIPWAFNDSQDR